MYEMDSTEKTSCYWTRPEISVETGSGDQFGDCTCTPFDYNRKRVLVFEPIIDMGNVWMSERAEVMNLARPVVPDLLIGLVLGTQCLDDELVIEIVKGFMNNPKRSVSDPLPNGDDFATGEQILLSGCWKNSVAD